MRHSRINKSSISILASLIFFVMIYYFIPYSSRSDFSNYVFTYNNLSYAEIIQHVGLGFGGLVEFSQLLKIDATTFYFLLFLIAVYLKCKSFLRLSENYILSIFLYASTVFPIQELITIAAGLATAFFVFSIQDIVKKNKVVYFIKIFLAVSIHYSAIIFFPLYFLSREKLSRFLYLVILLPCPLISLASQQIVDGASRIVGYLPFIYQIKFNQILNMHHKVDTNIFNLQSLFFYLFAIFIVLLSKKFKSSVDIICTKIFTLGVMSFYLFSFSPVFAFRLLELLTPVFVIIAANVFKYLKFNLKICYSISLFAFSMAFLFSISRLYSF